MGIATDRLKSEAASRGLKYVGIRGNTSAPLVIVGEAPGYEEEEQGYPFVGGSGKELVRMMAEASLTERDCWFTNPYKVRPPNNDIGLRSNNGIAEQIYLDQFFEELYEYKPSFIVACGATPLGILCPQTISKRKTKKGEEPRAKIGMWRGSLLTSPRIQWPHYVVAMHHPAYIMREWSERQVAVFCLARAYEEYAYYVRNGKLNPLPERQLITEPSAGTVKDYLRECLEKPNSPVSDDIETIGGSYPYTISVARSPKLAISFSFWNYDIQDLVQIWPLLDKVLSGVRTIGQNWLGFDCHWLEWLGFSPSADLASDTMVRHHVLWPEFEHKLQFQTFQYTREPYYKDEGKLWKPKEGIRRLQLYNCKDTTVTYEAHENQEPEFDDRPYLRTFLNEYAMEVARKFFKIEKRGVLVDTNKLRDLRDFVLREIDKNCQVIEKEVGRPVAAGEKEKKLGQLSVEYIARTRGIKKNQVLNIGSSQQLLKEFLARNIKVPFKRGSGKQSTDEESLRRIIIASPSEPLPNNILNLRELLKIKGTYVDAALLENTLYCSYPSTTVVTNRRSSRTNLWGFGTNLQNLPKYSELGHKYRDCIIARPGKIFVMCDQKGAEEWIVQGTISDQVGQESKGLQELRAGINRHRKLASFLLSMPEDQIDKDGIEYFMGKKTRHAGSYDMQGERLAAEMLKNGFNIPKEYCFWLLKKFHDFEPDIKGVYHQFIQKELKTKRKLSNPLGWERIFFSLRPFSNNEDIFRDGYSWLPQSTVAINTGLAIVYLENHFEKNNLVNTMAVVKDDHDAATLEVDDNDNDVINAVGLLAKSFDRVLRFPNGLELNIPIEVEMGYNLGHLKKCQDHSQAAGLKTTLDLLRNTQKVQNTTTSGVLQPS